MIQLTVGGGSIMDGSVCANPQYRLTYVDPKSGFGLLVSENRGECAFLNPLATVLWRHAAEPFEPDSLLAVAGAHLKLPGSADYLSKTIAEMLENGLIRRTSGDVVPDAAPTVRAYPLQQVYFYTTRECNARCFHCYQPTIHSSGNRVSPNGKAVSADSFLRFLRRALPLGLESVKLTGGEPLLRPDIGEIIRGVRELSLSISIETNAFFLDERMADLLVEQGVDVSISLDGGSPEIHDTLRGLPGSFARVMNAFRLLSERGGPPKAIMAVSRRNLAEVENVIQAARQCGCSVVKLNPVSTLGLAQRLARHQVLLTIDEILTLYQRRRELESRFGVFVFLEGPPSFASMDDFATGHAAVCPFLSLVGVLADGSLSFCGVGNSCPELIFGHVDEANVESWWRETAALVEVRRILNRKLDGICSQCFLEPICHGSCRALAYGEFGSFSAPHPWCQSAFEQGIFPAHYLRTQERR
jgi:SynChlorMet cassette radical SAM/SPASM protein ScmF